MSHIANSRMHAGGQGGFSLLEVLISILIFSLAILGIMGVQASMIKHSADARYRAVASHLAQQRLGQMWSDPTHVGTYIVKDADVSAALPGGTLTVVQPVPNNFVVTVRWQQPGQDVHTFTTSASIAGG